MNKELHKIHHVGSYFVQKPNPPIITWFVAMLLTWLVPAGMLEDLLRLIAFGALFTWAWLEVFDGANYFRRGLGVVVLVVTLWSHL